MSKQALIGFFFALIVTAVGIVIWSCKDALQIQNESLVKVNIAAMPYSFNGYSIFLASEKGYFKEQGLDVTLKASYPNGKATLNAAVMDPHYQLPLASTYIGSLITAGNIVSELIRIFKTTFNVLNFWQIHVLCKNPLGTSLVNW